jgi:hypothetical protein
MTNNLYTTWTRFSNYQSSNPLDSSVIFFSKSTDGGISWGEQKRISKSKGDATGGLNSVHGSYPTTGPNGELYVAWWNPDGLMLDKSTDEGETWLDEDINITGTRVDWLYLLPGIQTGVTFPVIVSDNTNGPNRGTLYINWADFRSGSDDCDIWLIKSTDGGMTWSEPKRVNDDAPGKNQFFNFMTIDPITGKIYILFYDRRNYTDDNTDVYLAISGDGGETFANYRISETPFIPFSTVFFGHYIGLSAYDNKVFASWMRMDEGKLTLWGASINPETVGIKKDSPVPASLSQNTPNPFEEYTFFSFKTESKSTVTLSVLDLLGKPVATLINGETMAAGKHVIHFSPEEYQLKPGIYYYSLVTENKTITRKMIYAKQGL